MQTESALAESNEDPLQTDGSAKNFFVSDYRPGIYFVLEIIKHNFYCLIMKI